jgi:hypothetical protein
VDLEQRIGRGAPLKSPLDFDEEDFPAEEAEFDEAQDSDEPARLETGSGFGEFSSANELLQAYNNIKTLLEQRSQEAAQYRQELDGVGNQNRMMAMQADDEAFLRQMRGYYDKDPVSAVDTMIHRAQQQLMTLVDMRMDQALREERNFGRVMEDFLSNPQNARLRPYEEEIAYLVRDKGLNPQEVTALLRGLEEKRDAAARKRTVAAKEVRNRSTVESDGEVGEPLDTEKELNRVIQKSKTLEEMFAGLRKLKL